MYENEFVCCHLAKYECIQMNIILLQTESNAIRDVVKCIRIVSYWIYLNWNYHWWFFIRCMLPVRVRMCIRMMYICAEIHGMPTKLSCFMVSLCERHRMPLNWSMHAGCQHSLWQLLEVVESNLFFTGFWHIYIHSSKNNMRHFQIKHFDWDHQESRHKSICTFWNGKDNNFFKITIWAISSSSELCDWISVCDVYSQIES